MSIKAESSKGSMTYVYSGCNHPNLPAEPGFPADIGYDGETDDTAGAYNNYEYRGKIF
jgi:hypothetical protein